MVESFKWAGSLRILSRHLANRFNNILHVLVSHEGKHGQAKDLFIGRFGTRAQARRRSLMLAIIRVKVDRNVMDVNADSFGS